MANLHLLSEQFMDSPEGQRWLEFAGYWQIDNYEQLAKNGFFEALEIWIEKQELTAPTT